MDTFCDNINIDWAFFLNIDIDNNTDKNIHKNIDNNIDIYKGLFGQKNTFFSRFKTFLCFFGEI